MPGVVGVGHDGKPKVEGRSSAPTSCQPPPKSSERYTPQWCWRKRVSGSVGCRSTLWTHWPNSGVGSGRNGARMPVLAASHVLPVEGPVEAGGGDGDAEAGSAVGIGDDGVEAQPAAARLPLGPVLVVPEPLVEPEGLAAVVASGRARPAPRRRRRRPAAASPAGWSCQTRATAGAGVRRGRRSVSGSGSTHEAPRSSDRYTDGPQCELVAPTRRRRAAAPAVQRGGVDLLAPEPRPRQLPARPARARRVSTNRPLVVPTSTTTSPTVAAIAPGPAIAGCYVWRWISCTAQRLPSGSAKKTKRPQGNSCTALHLHAPAGQLGPGRVDVGDDELHALHRARGRLGHALPDGDRAGRAGRGQLDEADLVADVWSWSAWKPTCSA